MVLGIPNEDKLPNTELALVKSVYDISLFKGLVGSWLYP